MQPADWFTILPNLSIGVISVLSLVIVVRWFLQALDVRAEKHEKAMSERETAMRSVESDVRNNLVSIITDSTSTIKENTKLMERVVHHLDGVSHIR